MLSSSPAHIFTPSCLDPHWPAGHLRSKHISCPWYDGKSSYGRTPSYGDFPSYENFLFGIWWIAIILTIQCMMELHHKMMLIHHKFYDSYKLYYCHNLYEVLLLVVDIFWLRTFLPRWNWRRRWWRRRRSWRGSWARNSLGGEKANLLPPINPQKGSSQCRSATPCTALRKPMVDNFALMWVFARNQRWPQRHHSQSL